jgi:UDP-N-acetylglucosamine 2-epimerase (non-hydrolysing)/GDP/UDP-N,N'-diacetylbacillosamine 2-epimerase (hydrolysing)
MGEEEWRITISGAPGLDDILASEYESPESVIEKYDIESEIPLFLVVQHPVTTQPEQAGKQMAQTLDAVESFDAQGILIYPNSDAGSDRIIQEIESRALGDKIHTFENLPRREYLGFMAAADVMIGNSSSGIIEAPSFDLPVVDIGPRQEGRERAENTISAPYNTEMIREAIARCLTDGSFREQAKTCKNPYDYGGAGERISEQLAEIEINEVLLQKRLQFNE